MMDQLPTKGMSGPQGGPVGLRAAHAEQGIGVGLRMCRVAGTVMSIIYGR